MPTLKKYCYIGVKISQMQSSYRNILLKITGSQPNITAGPPRHPRPPKRAGTDTGLISADIVITERVGRTQRPARVSAAYDVRCAH